jgi:hypothetical protein
MSVRVKLYNRELLIQIRIGLDSSRRYHENSFRSDRATSQQILAAKRLFEEIPLRV